MKMKVIITLVFFLFIFLSSPAWALKGVIIKSFSVMDYDIAELGFTVSCNCEVIKTINLKKMGQQTLKDSIFGDELNSNLPDFILTIGEYAMKKASRLKDIPIISILSMDLDQTISMYKNIRQIYMHLHPEQEWRSLKKILPNIKNVGVTTFSNYADGNIDKLDKAFPKLGLKLYRKRLLGPHELRSTLNVMAGKVDALLFPIDVGLVSYKTGDVLNVYSLRHEILLITYMPDHVKHGAGIGIDTAPFELGSQAARLLHKKLDPEKRFFYPKVAYFKFNRKIIEDWGIKIRDEYKYKKFLRVDCQKLAANGECIISDKKY